MLLQKHVFNYSSKSAKKKTQFHILCILVHLVHPLVHSLQCKWASQLTNIWTIDDVQLQMEYTSELVLHLCSTVNFKCACNKNTWLTYLHFRSSSGSKTEPKSTSSLNKQTHDLDHAHSLVSMQWSVLLPSGSSVIHDCLLCFQCACSQKLVHASRSFMKSACSYCACILFLYEISMYRGCRHLLIS